VCGLWGVTAGKKLVEPSEQGLVTRVCVWCVCVCVCVYTHGQKHFFLYYIIYIYIDR
jgi:hypothetical protein